LQQRLDIKVALNYLAAMAAHRSPKRLSLSTCLVLIVAIALAPALIFSAFLVNRFVEDKHAESLRFLEKSVDEMAYAFDQEIISTIRTLQALSMSKSLRDRDYKGFNEVLGRVLKTQPTWINILLNDSNLNLVLNANHPLSSKIGPAIEPESLKAVVETKRPIVGKVIPIPETTDALATQSFEFAVRVPIFNQAGELTYILSAMLPVDVAQTLATKFSTAPNELTRTIVDQFGVIAARSKDPDKFIGGHASKTFLDLLQKNTAGLSTTQSLENISVITAFRTAPLSGWTAAIGVPSEHLDQQVWSVMTTIVVSALLLLLFSTLVTVFLSRWLTRSLNSATIGAAQLAAGQVPQITQTKIREIEQLRESLLQASKLLKSRERTKGDFLANMSHELRTPLGIVLGTADLLSSDLIEDRERARAWETLKRNGEQLRRVIDDVLDFSKVEANKLVVENIDFSINDLVSSIIEDFTALANAKNLKLHLIVPERIHDIVSADPVRVRQIISNLISNAIKFTDKGEISVEIRQDQGKITVRVTDTGIGLSEQQKTALFSDFTQGDSSHTRKYGGTGLGLSLSRKLARLLSGDVKLLSSEAGAGSVFEFSFIAPPSVDQSQVLHKKVRNETPTNLSKRKILLAEDSQDNVDLLQAYLRNSGAEIHIATNGAEACTLAKAVDFDLILMDIQMPVMDGFEATELIRKTNSDVPILALTAHALFEQRSRALASGFDGYITKPISRENLFEAISKFFL
jgi:signal transduction histidine kinase